MNNVIIRYATVADAEAIWNIYRYYVEHTAISFEITMPTVKEMRGRIQRTLKAFPYLVAEVNGTVLSSPGRPMPTVRKCPSIFHVRIATAVWGGFYMRNCWPDWRSRVFPTFTPVSVYRRVKTNT